MRGRVEVRPGGESLQRAAKVWVGGKEFALQGADRTARGWLVALAGVEAREAADALRGREVEVRREDLPALEPDEFYAADLVGCRVVGEEGVLGEVVGVEEVQGAPDLLVVRREGKGELLVPAAAGIVVKVDLAAREVVVKAPEGLFDL